VSWVCFFFFFFSSRRRHTRFDCDWSSDVCSSDLVEFNVEDLPRASELGGIYTTYILWAISPDGHVDSLGEIKRSGSTFVDSKLRSEERRVGKECRCRWWPYE